jgi:hypothetical protein
VASTNWLAKIASRSTSLLKPVTENIHKSQKPKNNSKYAQHIPDTGHPYGSIENTMKVLQLASKGKYMNTLEKFRIFSITRKCLQINETYTDLTSPIYDILIKT